ncbi:MAG: helix-turn-helix transcriptional regulator [Actinomycetota bacterium]|nr:helix-turn-helix transcriptional regulator [Actinomycetota bacterium]
MGIREGMLALLADGPKYGYQLKREFEVATGEAWALNVGQVYTTLQRLERDGLIEAHETDDKERHSYRITDRGQDTFVEWMTQPIEPSVANRDDLSMKVLLAMTSGVVDAAVVIDVQRASTMTALQDYQRLRAETPETDLAWMLLLDRLVYQGEAELRWLDRIEDRIEQASTERETTITATRATTTAVTRASGSTND